VSPLYSDVALESKHDEKTFIHKIECAFGVVSLTSRFIGQTTKMMRLTNCLYAEEKWKHNFNETPIYLLGITWL
jgi:hypothetical protein